MKKLSSILILTMLAPVWFPIVGACLAIVICFFVLVASVMSIGWAFDNLLGKPTQPYTKLLKKAWPL